MTGRPVGWEERVVTASTADPGCCACSWVVRQGGRTSRGIGGLVMGVNTVDGEDEEITTVWPRVRAQGGATVSDGDTGDDADSGDSGDDSDSSNSGSDSDSDSGDSGDDSDSTDR